MWHGVRSSWGGELQCGWHRGERVVKAMYPFVGEKVSKDDGGRREGSERER